MSNYFKLIPYRWFRGRDYTNPSGELTSERIGSLGCRISNSNTRSNNQIDSRFANNSDMGFNNLHLIIICKSTGYTYTDNISHEINVLSAPPLCLPALSSLDVDYLKLTGRFVFSKLSQS